MSMGHLPCEMLRDVFATVDPQDVPRLRFVCRTFDAVIKRNYKFLPRIPYTVKAHIENGQCFISHKRSGNLNDRTEVRSFAQKSDICTFDFDLWNEISIVEMEIQNFDKKDEVLVSGSLELIIQNLVTSKQQELRKLTLKDVNLDASLSDQLNYFFNLMIPRCETVVFENCRLPISLSSELINASSFDHYRWINSTSSQEVPNDLILRKMTKDMKKAVNKRSLLAELDSVTVENACDFIEAWLRLPVSSFFNLSFHNCDETWKSRFLAECEKRRLTHHYMEFQSKTHANAHIKVSFSQDTKTCCIWPILDVPARTTGQSVCYSRYFRDF